MVYKHQIPLLFVNDPPIFQSDGLIHSRQPSAAMRDHQHRPPGHERLQRLHQHSARSAASRLAVASSRIRTGASFRIVAGNRQPLALASAEQQAILTDQRIITGRQRRDKIVQLRLPAGRHNLLVGRIRVCQQQIVLQRGVEQMDMLEIQRRSSAAPPQRDSHARPAPRSRCALRRTPRNAAANLPASICPIRSARRWQPALPAGIVRLTPSSAGGSSGP